MKKILPIFVVMAFISGCAAKSHFEYRYRVFYGVDVPTKETLSAEELSRFFYPLGSLNRSLDILGEEGFILQKYRRLGDSQNYVFTFRRAEKKESLIKGRSRRIGGVYEIEKESSRLLLAVTPSSDGAQVVYLDGVKRIYPAQMSDKEVLYETTEGRILLSFSSDGDVEMKIETESGNTTVIKTYQGQKLGQNESGADK